MSFVIKHKFLLTCSPHNSNCEDSSKASRSNSLSCRHRSSLNFLVAHSSPKNGKNYIELIREVFRRGIKNICTLAILIHCSTPVTYCIPNIIGRSMLVHQLGPCFYISYIGFMYNSLHLKIWLLRIFVYHFSELLHTTVFSSTTIYLYTPETSSTTEFTSTNEFMSTEYFFSNLWIYIPKPNLTKPNQT